MSRQERTAKATKRAKAKVEKMTTPQLQAVRVTCAWRSVVRGNVMVGVHAPDCKDLIKEQRQADANLSTDTFKVKDLDDLEGQVLSDLNTDFQDDPYGPEAVRVYNCAKALVTGKPAEKPAEPTKAGKATSPAPAPRQAASGDLAAECRRLRDEQGMAWWLIGKTLNLPGAGNSAATGKSGAHQARRLYASTGKEVPRTRAPRGKAAERQGPGKAGTKTERKTMLTLGEQVIPEDMPAEEVVSMLAGKVIEWGVNLADLCGGPDDWYNHEARVHPTDVIVDDKPAKDGSRTLRFREFYGYDSSTHRPLSGPTRTVRIRAIHTVRG